MLRRYIGDKAFYRRVLGVALPIIIQNGITNFVSLLDNIMVGQVGTLQMSGVSIVNQLLFVFNLCVFGAVSGAGIFTAQFFGSQDHEGVRHTFRFKFLVSVGLVIVGTAVFLLAGQPLIRLYLQGDGDPRDVAITLAYGSDYLRIMLLGLLPFALASAYSSTLRETGQTMVPMVGGIVAVFVNLVFNYILIFGHFGAPAMGIRGAAVATVLSRYVELAIVAGWTHLKSGRNPFIEGAYSSMRIPRGLLKGIIIKGMPLLVNEALWSLGMAFLNQCYSVRGLDVVAAMNIATTLNNLASVVFLSMGNTVGIIIGQMLGAGKSAEEVRDADNKLIAVAVVSCLVFGGLMALAGEAFPHIYNTTDSVRHIATRIIWICAAFMPIHSYCNATYFTLRSGGQTMVTFLFDSCYVWVCSVPLAFCLSRFTSLPIVWLYLTCSCMDLVKCVLGYIMLRRGTWIQNLAKTE